MLKYQLTQIKQATNDFVIVLVLIHPIDSVP